VSMQDTPHIFNRQAKKLHRNRCTKSYTAHNFLVQECAKRLIDRLLDIRKKFPQALDLGCHSGDLSENLGRYTGIQHLIQADLSPEMAALASRHGPSLAADEEWLPFKPNCFDLVLSNLSLHWINDLPGTFVQIRQTLNDDGLFLSSMLGGETLRELRHALMTAELELENGASARISPFADVKDLGNLLSRAGFALPVSDTEIITVNYQDPFRLLTDLRGMGESNAVHLRKKSFMRRQTLMRAMEIYREQFGNPDGTCPATFEVITLTAWKPHASQQQPLKPGSGKIDLASVIATDDQDPAI